MVWQNRHWAFAIIPRFVQWPQSAGVRLSPANRSNHSPRLHVERERQRLQLPGLERADVLLDVAMAERIRERDVGVVVDARADESERAIAYDHRASVVRLRTESGGR